MSANGQYDEKFMRCAIEKALEGIDEGQSPFGACIIKDGSIVGCAHNRVWKNKDATAHAEVEAIREACSMLNTIDLSECIIYSTCEPCPMCFSACHWSRIKKIVFGARIEDAKKFGFNELAISNDKMKRMGNDEIEIIGDLLRAENIEVFKTWSARKGSRVY